MTDNWIERDALGFEGFNQQQIDQIFAAIPKAQAFAALVQSSQADIAQGEALVKSLNALAQKNMAALTQAESLIKELAPVANMVLTVMKGRM